MSQADDLLATLSVDYTDEAHIYVNDDRTITVPDELKHIAVQGDHNIETVTFDCPRYWDGHDFSKMKVYVTYMRADGFKDSYPAKNLRISEEDDTRILFDWTISGNVTKVSGNLSFLVCIESTSANPCWHSRLNQQMVVDEGLSATEQILRAPDSIEAVLAQTTADYIAEAKAEIEGKTAQSLASIPEDYTTVNNMAEEALREKSNAVKMEAYGEVITVNDSADNSLLGLKLYGKTTQITTTGKNLFDVAAALTNQKRGTAAVNDYTAYGNGVRVTSNSYDNGRAYMYLTLNAGSYNISANVIVNSSWNFSVKNYDTNIELVNDTRSTAGEISYSFTLDSTALIGFCFMSVVTGGPATTATDIQLEIGSAATAYEPYSGGVASPSPQWPQELKSIETPTVEFYGKNLLQPKANKSGGYTVVVNEDGSVTVTGAATTTNSIYLTVATCSMENPIVLDRNLKYYMWSESSNGKYIGTKTLDSNGDAAWSTASTWNKHVGTDYMTIVQLYLESSGHAVGDTSLCGTYRFQLELGDSFTGFESYKDTRSITSQRSIRGIPVSSGGNYTDSDGQQWVCDEIDFERGVYVQRIYDMVFTGNETISRENNSTWSEGCYVVYTGKDHPNHVHGECMCTFLPAHSNADLADGKFECGIGTHGQPNLLVRFSKNINTLESFRTAWNSAISAGGKVYCILATPIETPLTDAELASFKMVRTHYSNTTVLNDSGAHMAIKYAADTKTYVDNSLSNATLVDTATGKLYRLTVTNGQLTVVAV